VLNETGGFSEEDLLANTVPTRRHVLQEKHPVFAAENFKSRVKMFD